MKSRYPMLAVALLAALSLAGCEKSDPESTDAASVAVAPPGQSGEAAVAPVRYRVEFTPSWTRTNFPYEYPHNSLIHKPHFSGWIGTGHDDGYALFKEGDVPTPGLEMLAQMGKHMSFDDEIKAAIAAGHATALAQSEPLRDFSRKANFEIVLDEAHPMASAVAMIAPSPDWFAGFDVRLMENGAWLDGKRADVMAWDAGGDAGMTYVADDADSDPKQPVAAATVMQFMKDGKVMPVGTVSFTRM